MIRGQLCRKGNDMSWKYLIREVFWDFGNSKASVGKVSFVALFFLLWKYLIREVFWDFGKSKATVGRLVLWLYFLFYLVFFVAEYHHLLTALVKAKLTS